MLDVHWNEILLFSNCLHIQVPTCWDSFALNGNCHLFCWTACLVLRCQTGPLPVSRDLSAHVSFQASRFLSPTCPQGPFPPLHKSIVTRLGTSLIRTEVCYSLNKNCFPSKAGCFETQRKWEEPWEEDNQSWQGEWKGYRKPLHGGPSAKKPGKTTSGAWIWEPLMAGTISQHFHKLLLIFFFLSIQLLVIMPPQSEPRTHTFFPSPL